MRHPDEDSRQAPVPRSPRVGWIGTGVMGRAMCERLIAKGYRLVLHTRTPDKAQPLLQQGAEWGASPRAVAEHSSIVFTMVGFPHEVREVYFSTHGVLAGAKPGSLLVDMTSTEPALARDIYAAAGAKGMRAVDAPVSGGDVGAREGALSIMIGGDEAVVEELMPLFDCLGKKILYQGGPGSGQHTKLCNQIVIAGTMIGVCESLLYGHKAGLQVETMLRSISGGAAACWSLDHLAPRILKRDFEPGFFVDHFIKDMSIALAEAARLGLSLPGLALVHQLYLSVRAHGHGRCGTQALMLALEELSSMGATSKDGS
ncbi:MAG: NAD(P)-dependent oxidoreductase [Nitrospiraceae bacterium]